MTMLGVHVKIDSKLVAKGMQDLGAEIPKIGRLQIYQVVLRSRTRLRKPGKKVHYPVQWDSPRQKIKVIILLKYVLKQLPYKRTEGYQQGFTIVKQKEGYDLDNATYRAKHIGGDADGLGQSRIFRGRYPLIRKVVDDEFAKLPAAVVEHIQIVGKQKGFKTNG